MESEVPTEIVISSWKRRSTPGTMYTPSPHGKTARRTAAPDRHDIFTFHRFHCSRSSWTGAFICGCATSRRDFPITKFFSCRINGKDFKRRTVHPEPDIASGKGKSVNPFGIILIGRARIKGQNLTVSQNLSCICLREVLAGLPARHSPQAGVPASFPQNRLSPEGYSRRREGRVLYPKSAFRAAGRPQKPVTTGLPGTEAQYFPASPPTAPADLDGTASARQKRPPAHCRPNAEAGPWATSLCLRMRKTPRSARYGKNLPTPATPPHSDSPVQK